MVQKNLKTKSHIEGMGTGFGITGLILGILSILMSIFIPLISVIAGILGIIFSKKQMKVSPIGTATAGLVISIIGLVLGIISWVVTAILVYNGLSPQFYSIS